MRLNARMIATAAFVVFLMSALSLGAEEAAKPSTAAIVKKHAASSSIRRVWPIRCSLFTCRESSMAAATPYSEGVNTGYSQG